ncbi:helix-turn-helix transcriptional regulator [Bradyrhizobium lablabi]|uniref:helix-turn-helix domain-containing protein n=1 Tax=Bradyrhizobium lablabi TaxID=722472 RepID=UPI001BA5AC99|nr:AraC family transcriptional regulator [Bradyrhizobium lablabi]MBR1121505.1 helix-turn-helix transcriptional regulator [Bradyrhizobium lablabi]
MTKSGETIWTQCDDGPPTDLETGRAHGESGVSILRMNVLRTATFKAARQQHLIFLQLSPHLRLECRVGGSRRRHEATTGSIAICPAGWESSVETDMHADFLVAVVKPDQFALAAAEDSAIAAQLHECDIGHDQTLLGLAKVLAAENAAEYQSGLLLWNRTATSFINRLVLAHTRIPTASSRGSLGLPVLNKIRDYVHANLSEPIEVNDLASLAGQSPFHFTRVFARSIGVTPYRYVVHLRLRAAIERIQRGMSLAEVAADTGFADQSHLSRWIRRVHGVTPSQLA